MKKVIAAACFMMATMAVQSCGNNTSDNKEDSVDSAQEMNDNMNTGTSENASDFMTKAADGGMMEVQLGQMAQQKAINPRVKDFGLMMIRDHSKGNDDLKALAAQKNVVLPQTLSDDNQKHVDELSKQQGNDWDKAYLDMMISDHKGDIDEFTEAGEKVDDPAIKSYAKENVSVMQMHLDSAKAIKESMK